MNRRNRSSSRRRSDSCSSGRPARGPPEASESRRARSSASGRETKIRAIRATAQTIAYYPPSGAARRGAAPREPNDSVMSFTEAGMADVNVSPTEGETRRVLYAIALDPSRKYGSLEEQILTLA